MTTTTSNDQLRQRPGSETSPRSKVEHIKEGSDGLRGTIAQELDSTTDHVSDAVSKILKFHGTYQQDDRDSRRERRRRGLDDSQFTVHMTGCPNGCARPYNCDIGLVWRTLNVKNGEGKYTIFVGGNRIGTRMNVVYMDLVPQSQIVAALRPLLVKYRNQRADSELLGNFCHRMGVTTLLHAGPSHA